MPFEHDSFLRDLEQIAAHSRVNADALAEMANQQPDYSQDFTAMREKSLSIAADLEAIAERAKADVEAIADINE